MLFDLWAPFNLHFMLGTTYTQPILQWMVFDLWAPFNLHSMLGTTYSWFASTGRLGAIKAALIIKHSILLLLFLCFGLQKLNPVLYQLHGPEWGRICGVAHLTSQRAAQISRVAPLMYHGTATGASELRLMVVEWVRHAQIIVTNIHILQLV